MRRTILLVDDDPTVLTLMEHWLERDGFDCLTASDGKEALAVFDDRDPDLVISDLIMAGMNGIDLLKMLRKRSKEIPVILVTSYGSIPSAVEAMKAGADDYLTKPLHPDELLLLMERVFQRSELRREVARLRSEVGDRYSFERIVGKSKSMRKLLTLAERVAERDVTVLIQGESGCGKELLARAIHQASARRERPFFPVDCGSLADSLLESELFGHVRGAFSGAVRTRRGMFAEAEGGTLFLDEVGNMSLNLQVKLLRVLQEREVKAVGSNDYRRVDVRILAATNTDLTGAIESGAFRDDLYYRLAVVTLLIPPLRERCEDIPELCSSMLSRIEETGPKRLEPKALEKVVSYGWPGNVRELENAMHRSALLSDGEWIRPDHLPESVREFDPGRSLVETAKKSRLRLEREVVLAALKEADGNRAKAARLLNISRSSLYNRLRQLEID